MTQAYLQANDKEKAKQYWKDAKDKKLDQIRFGPGGLHPLEQSAYQKVLRRIGIAMTGKRAYGTGSRSSSFLPDHGFEVVPVVVGDFGGKLLDLLRRDKPHAVGDFLETGNFESLA